MIEQTNRKPRNKGVSSSPKYTKSKLPQREKAVFEKSEVQLIIKWVNKHFIKCRIDNFDVLNGYWCGYVNKLYLSQGAFTTIQRIKSIRLHVTRYLAGTPLLTNHDNIRLDKAGLPSCLGPLKSLINTNKALQDTRLLFTFLTLSRSVPGGHQSLDVSPITDPPTTEYIADDFDRDIEVALQDLGLNKRNTPV